MHIHALAAVHFSSNVKRPLALKILLQKPAFCPKNYFKNVYNKLNKLMPNTYKRHRGDYKGSSNDTLWDSSNVASAVSIS